MKTVSSEAGSSWRAAQLGRYIGVGLLCGLAYAVIDQYLDASLQASPRNAVVEHLHHFIDLALPLLAGGVFGAASHFLQVRAARARGEAKRADDLHARLTRVERDQAVWVVVASTLHEIKNPLHALGLLLSEVLELRADEQEPRQHLLRKMSQQLGRVQKNVDALRSLSVRSAPTPETVELCALARRVAGDLLRTGSSPRAELSWRGSSQALVRADPAHLRLILENLLENAFEAVASEELGRVTLDIDADGDVVRLRVLDNGPGVPSELQAELFEPLATSKPGGLGLGLPIARALARAMGGDVALGTDATYATTLVLTLPRGEP